MYCQVVCKIKSFMLNKNKYKKVATFKLLLRELWLKQTLQRATAVCTVWRLLTSSSFFLFFSCYWSSLAGNIYCKAVDVLTGEQRKCKKGWQEGVKKKKRRKKKPTRPTCVYSVSRRRCLAIIAIVFVFSIGQLSKCKCPRTMESKNKSEQHVFSYICPRSEQ